MGMNVEFLLIFILEMLVFEVVIVDFVHLLFFYYLNIGMVL